jgi:hypothetical protein
VIGDKLLNAAFDPFGKEECGLSEVLPTGRIKWFQ